MVAMLVLGVLMLGMASIAAYGYVETKGRIASIAGRDPVSPARATTGPAVVEGTVALAGVEPLRAPVTGEEAVLVDWEREEDIHAEDEGPSTTGRHAVDFALVDDDGRVRVRPGAVEAVTVSNAARTDEVVRDHEQLDEALLERLQAFDADVRDDDPTFHAQSSTAISHGMGRLSGDTRLIQRVFAPGDSVTVVGEVSRDQNGDLVVEDGGDGPFLLSDMGPDGLRETYASNQHLLLAVVAVLLAVAGYGFANFLGVL